MEEEKKRKARNQSLFKRTKVKHANSKPKNESRVHQSDIMDTDYTAGYRSTRKVI